MLNKILAERPTDVVDFFEEYSRKIKERRYRPLTDHLEDIYVIPARYELANNIIPMLKVSNINGVPSGRPSIDCGKNTITNSLVSVVLSVTWS